MNTEDAVRHLRADPAQRQLIEDAYLDVDVGAASARFGDSAEFRALLSMLGADLREVTLVDLGSGNGMAARAFSSAGVACVVAVEPDPSDEIGAGAVRRLSEGSAISVVRSIGEGLPLADCSVGVVYCRQVLHHTSDLQLVMREVARVLRPAGLLIACREHVVDDEGQLNQFLASHPVHQLAGGEHAFPLDAYISAIIEAGLSLRRVLGPWDSVINAYPTVRSEGDRKRYPDLLLTERLGCLGSVIARLPGAQALVWRRLNRPTPGRLYSFLASKDSVPAGN